MCWCCNSPLLVKRRYHTTPQRHLIKKTGKEGGEGLSVNFCSVVSQMHPLYLTAKTVELPFALFICFSEIQSFVPLIDTQVKKKVSS